jgi:hypothetical protein
MADAEAVATADTKESKTVAKTPAGTLMAAWPQYEFAYDAGGEAQYPSSRVTVAKATPLAKPTWGYPGYGSPE